MLIHTDKHHNIFMPYGAYHLENNVTKALLNVFDMLSTDIKNEIFNYFFDADGEVDTVSFSYYMQIKPSKVELDNISSLESNKKVLVAINPNGKTWNDNLLTDDKTNFDNVDNYKKELNKAVSEKFDTGIKKIVKEEVSEIENFFNNRGSIPDGWLLKYQNNILTHCIIIETKLYDLNPIQLRNHAEKSLSIDLIKKPDTLKFITFNEIYSFLDNKDNNEEGISKRLISDLLEYLSVLELDVGKELSSNEIEFLNDLTIGNIKDKEFYLKIIDNKLNNNISNIFKNNGVDYNLKTRRIEFSDCGEFNSVVDFNLSERKIFISTEVGVRCKNTCIRIMNRFRNDKELVNKIELSNKNAKYHRYIRISNGRNNNYFFVEEYSTLTEYLDSYEFKDTFVYYSKAELSQIFNDKPLNKNSNNEKIQRLMNGKTKEWHVLEYLRIMTPLEMLNQKEFNKDNFEEGLLNIVESKEIECKLLK